MPRAPRHANSSNEAGLAAALGPIRSATKAMTAAWIAHIVLERQLTWESTVGSVLPGETAGASDAFRGITRSSLPISSPALRDPPR